ncbi:MAG: CCA tRNA nucleotidyltransferase [Deltaproteobacteria bacterium]|nr:CCA tRNA nucleotidyltransferase [Deltaproteobacteria bacterium]MBN2673435.1 CCA tRNA nucleotidyltransferase [Deltaproteobacteria bacterium]
MECEKIDFDIPFGVRKICKILQENGEDGFLVGGSVRDLLLGVPPGDFDLASTATPEKMMSLFRRVIPTGIDHGTVTVVIKKNTFEVTTLRSEQGYTDGRHPDSVKYVTDIVEDLSRRDFTVNAIAWNPLTKELFDPFGGRGDLSARILRAVGDAHVRFEEDGLRIMRAARFAATLEFELEASTLNAISGAAYRLENVSVERKRVELQKLLLAVRPSCGLRVMAEHNIFKYICRDGVGADTPQSWQTLYQRVDAVPASFHLRLAALFLRVPPVHLNAWLEHFLIDKRTKKRVLSLCVLFPVPFQPEWSDAEVRRFLSCVGKEHYGDFLSLFVAQEEADNGNRIAARQFDERVKSIDGLGSPLTISELAVSGKDLISVFGLSPGRQIGVMLERLLQRVLETPAENSKERLVAIAKTFLSDS